MWMRVFKLTLENVTNRNIEILAEGHQIINRRPDDAVKSENNIEMTRIRTNILEEEIKKKKSDRDLSFLYLMP